MFSEVESLKWVFISAYVPFSCFACMSIISLSVSDSIMVNVPLSQIFTSPAP